MVYQQTLQAKLHSLGYPEPVAERKFKVNVLVRTKTGIKSCPGFGLRLVDARAAGAKVQGVPKNLPNE